jgi:hypothetical protein
MSNTDFEFDPIEEGKKADERPARSILPEGVYEAEIIDAKYTETKAKRGMQIALTWQVVKGEHEKRWIFQNILVQHDSKDAEAIGRAMLSDICRACDVTGKLSGDFSPLFYKPCDVRVGIEQDRAGHYPDRNRVKLVAKVGTMYRPPARPNKSAAPSAPTEPAPTDLPDDELPF